MLEVLERAETGAKVVERDLAPEFPHPRGEGPCLIDVGDGRRLGQLEDELVLAAYLETKLRLGEAAAAELDLLAAPELQFRALWLGAHRHLAADPGEARFLIQVDGSPYAEVAHTTAMERGDDPLVRAAEQPAMAARLLPLPLEVLYELGMAPAVRLAARELPLSTRELDLIAAACWRAITRPDQAV